MNRTASHANCEIQDAEVQQCSSAAVHILGLGDLVFGGTGFTGELPPAELMDTIWMGASRVYTWRPVDSMIKARLFSSAVYFHAAVYVVSYNVGLQIVYVSDLGWWLVYRISGGRFPRLLVESSAITDDSKLEIVDLLHVPIVRRSSWRHFLGSDIQPTVDIFI